MLICFSGGGNLELASQAFCGVEKIKKKCYFSDIKHHNYGFTLAEVLITLGIIGVVVALTLPTLLASYRKNVVETRLETTYSLIYNALKLAENDYEDSSLWDVASSGIYSDDFIKKYIVPYAKVENCSYHSDQYSVYTPSGNLAFHVIWSQNNNMYCLANGVAILGRAHGSNGRIAGQVIIVDINGPDGTNNKYGKDVFKMYFANEAMRSDSYYHSRCPKGLSFCADDGFGGTSSDLSRQEIIDNCLNKGGNSGLNACGYMIQNNNWKVPKDYPVRI